MLSKNSWPLLSLNKRKKNINTNPDYQRPSVWNTRQKQLLIDSILRDYDIPKIYLNKIDKDHYDVVDGQQRIRTVWSFYNDEFALLKDSDAVDGIEVAGKKYSELDPGISDIIDTYNMDFIILEDKSEDEIREMFLRLQNGTSLKAQEKRNAIPSKMRDFVKHITTHSFFDKVNFKDSRFTYDLVAAQMCRLGLEKSIVNIKDSDLNSCFYSCAFAFCVRQLV